MRKNTLRHSKWTGLIIIFLLIGATLITTNNTRSPDLNSSQIRDDILISGALDINNSISQSFLATKPNLSTIQINLFLPQGDLTGNHTYNIFLNLKNSRLINIASQSYSISTIEGRHHSLKLNFQPQLNSKGQQYYLFIDSDAQPGNISVWSSYFDNYEFGKAFFNGEPAPYDLTFWTYYIPSPQSFTTELLTDHSTRFLYYAFITLLFFFLGFSIIALLNFYFDDPIELIVASITLGITTPYLLFLLMTLIRQEINSNNIKILIITIMIMAGIKFLFQIHKHNIHYYSSPSRVQETLPLIALLLLATFTRILQINELLTPSWIDGFIHQKHLTKLIADQTISIDAIYPRAFHANVVLLNLILGKTTQETLLVFGQWLSTMTGVTYYLLARKILRAPYSFLATTLYWFWAVFPAFLINWSRYPFLQGIVIIPIIIAINNKSDKNHSHFALIILLLVGLTFTHYGS